MIKFILSITLLCAPMVAFGAEESSAKQLLEELNSFLTPKNMKSIIPDRKGDEVFRLAQEEDMEISDNYVISNELILMIRRKGFLGTPFGQLVEELQVKCDKLDARTRIEVLSEWKSLWLDKTADYLRYHKSLKRRWTLDLVHSIDYDSNISLQPQDTSVSQNADKDAVGLGGTFGLNVRPWVNSKKMKKWNVESRLSGTTRRVSREKSVQYDIGGFSQKIGYADPSKFFKSTVLHYSFRRSFNQNPSRERMDFDQHSLSLGVRYLPKKFKGGFFSHSRLKTKVEYRIKKEFEDATIGAGAGDEDSEALVISFGQNLMRFGEGIAFQTFGWNLRYETQDTDPSVTRDYSYVTLGGTYSRRLNQVIFNSPLTWRNGFSVRIKSWSTPAVGSTEDESQFSLSTSLRARWTSNWSSSLRLSYLNKSQDNLGGGGDDIDQWRVVYSSTFLTF